MSTPLLVDPHRFALPFGGETLPLGVIALDSADEWAGPLFLPPFPLVGIGDPSHPLAAQLDMIVEPPVTLEGLARSVLARPEAAATAVQLLRLAGPLAVQSALVAESIAYGMLQGGSEHAAWLARRRPPAIAPPGELAVTRRAGQLEIRLARQAARNAIDRPMRDALREAFELAALDDGIERIVLRATGRAFSIGADLAEFGTTRDPPTAHAIRLASLPAPAIARCADRLHVHVQGACVGAGLEMAAFGKRVTARPGAWFQLPELALGLIPGAGGCVSVSRRVGRGRAALMILSGRRIDAGTALNWGLIDAIVDD